MNPLEKAEDCPRCNRPLNGSVCKHCGCNPYEVTVRFCYDCGLKMTDEQAIENTYQKPISAAYRTDHYCGDCY